MSKANNKYDSKILCASLENAFKNMKIKYHIHTHNDTAIIYELLIPYEVSGSFSINLVIDKLFLVSFSSRLAQSISSNKRVDMLEAVNRINNEFRFVTLRLDKNNDITAFYEFMLSGSIDMICKQIITNLLICSDIISKSSKEIIKAILK